MLDKSKIDLPLLNHIIQKYKETIPFQCLKFPRNNKILRSSTNFDNQFHQNIARLSYPPIDKARTDRASLKRKPMFYGSIFTSSAQSDNCLPSITTIFETSDLLRCYEKEGKLITTQSLWKNQRDLRLLAFPFRSNYKNPCSEILENRNRWEHTSKDNFSNDANAFSEFMGELMATKNEGSCLYEITARMIDAILYDNINSTHLDGIVYPSVWTEGQGMNICLKKEVVDECIQFIDAKMVYLNKKNGDATIVTIANSMKDSEGNLKWKPTPTAVDALLQKHGPEAVLSNNMLYFQS